MKNTNKKRSLVLLLAMSPVLALTNTVAQEQNDANQASDVRACCSSCGRSCNCCNKSCNNCGSCSTSCKCGKCCNSCGKSCCCK